MGDDSGFWAGGECCHKGPYMKAEAGSESEKDT